MSGLPSWVMNAYSASPVLVAHMFPVTTPPPPEATFVTTASWKDGKRRRGYSMKSKSASTVVSAPPAAWIWAPTPFAEALMATSSESGL